MGAPASAAPPTIPGRLVLKLRPGGTPAALAGALAQLGATGCRQKFPHALPLDLEKPGAVDLLAVYEVAVPPGLPLARARKLLLGTGEVAYVEPLYVRAPLQQPNDPRADSTLTDPNQGQYYLRQIGAYRAWDLAPGDSTLVIGITDGGVRLTHEDLKGHVQHNYADPINGIDDDKDGYVDNFTGWDLANGDNNAGFDAAIIHGTLAAGVCAATPNNGRGIAGAGLNCRFLPLNIYPNVPSGAFAGFEAIVYAADHGCRVINMSWGGTGGYSQFEQDACTYAAVNRDAVLVAAAGNTNADLLFYPASYEHVISVSGVDNADRKAPNATYSWRVDLVAPGIDILTTYGYQGTTPSGAPDADYIAVGGTSFAAPLVAAGAALVRQRFPAYTAAQVAAQLRQTTDPIGAVAGNAAFAGRLGTGRLNLYRAVAAPAREVRVTASTVAPLRRSYAPGTALRLTATVQNLLQPVAGLTVTLTSLSPYVVVTQGAFAVGNLPTLATADNAAAPFTAAVAATGVPLNATAVLRYRLTAADGYQTDQFVPLLLNPDYVTLDAGDLHLTVTSRGKLGYDDLAATLGDGATYQGEGPLLSEGGLLLATAPARVADRLRTSGGNVRQSFFSTAQVGFGALGPRADQLATGTFQDSVPAAGAPVRSVGVRVRQRAYAWATAARKDFVVLEYTLRNLTADTLKPLCAGLFMDWDLPSAPGRNAAAYDSARALGYCYDLATARLYAGVQLLRGGAPAVYSLNNNAPAGSPVRLADGFSPAEKYLTVSSGTARTQRIAGLPNGADVSQVVGTRLARLAPGDSVRVAFAVLAARSLPELQAAADAARLAYAIVLPTRATAGAPGFAAFPNPTAGPLRLELPPGFGLTEIQVLNALGQTVLRRPSSGASAELDLSGLAPGLYIVRARGTGGVLARGVVRR
ncbi:T9SS C-terminal target domain-containing protein [Hymenobacter nivis]|uniref:T9SS C-terminal target domain-containing protein n=1 Tax=Hymenobacter nivis TaxID=1850093 RepID=A0A502HEP4_9BACT|nr:T9SS C-terminal target domain-containing protein [Hymenobacter nivis]